MAYNPFDMAGVGILLAPLNGLLNFFQKERHHSTEQEQYAEERRKEALEAMYAALLATRKYQENNVFTVDRDKEYEISQLWATAAIKSRKYFTEVANKNATKALYWLQKDKWPHDVVVERGIDLTTIEAQIRHLMEAE